MDSSSSVAARAQVAASVRFGLVPAEIERLATALGLAGTMSPGASASVSLDLSATTDFDSSLLALLLELRRRAQSAGRTLLLQGIPPRLHKLIALYGAQGILA